MKSPFNAYTETKKTKKNIKELFGAWKDISEEDLRLFKKSWSWKTK